MVRQRRNNDRAGATAEVGDPIYLKVREQLRNDILAGIFAPGARIKIADVATRYGVSQMPVRESLQMLQGEGLVTIAPNRGASVREVDERFIHNMYDIRGVIEALLVRRCVARIQDANIAMLQAIEARYEACVRAGDRDGVLLQNQDLHRVIYAAADNPEALELLERNWGLIRGLRRTFGFGPERDNQIIQEHRSLIESLTRRDSAEAERVILLHCDNARKDLIAQRRLAAARTRATAAFISPSSSAA